MLDESQGRKSNVMKKIIICTILFAIFINLVFLETQQIEGVKNTCIRQQENTTRDLLWKVYSAEPGVNMRGYSFHRKKMAVWHLKTSIQLMNKYNECIRRSLNELWEDVQIISITSNSHFFRSHLRTNKSEQRNKKNISIRDITYNARFNCKDKTRDFVSLVFFCKNPQDYRTKFNYCNNELAYYYKYLYKMICAKNRSDSILFMVYPDSLLSIKVYDSEKLTYIVELSTHKTTAFQNYLLRARLLSLWGRVRLREHTNKEVLSIEMRNPA